MAWYWILLIIIGTFVGVFVFFFILSRLTKPRFKNAKKYLTPQVVVSTIEEKKDEVKKTNPVGLNLDGFFKVDEESYFEDEKDKEIEFSDEDFEKFNYHKKEKKKTLIEQIRELSPELKMLIFDRGLARKEYDFKSKKD